MPTLEITKSQVESYVKQHGLFPVDAKLDIINIASEVGETEGLVNLVYRVVDAATRHSLIMKQVMPYMLALLKNAGEMHPLEANRIDKEIRSMVLMNVIYKDITPEVYLLDVEKGIICMEDLGHLGIMRFRLAEMNMYPDFGIRIGAFLAEMLFYTSELYLKPWVKKQWEPLFDAQESKKLMVDLFYEGNCVLFNLNKPFEEEARETHRRIAAKQNLKELVRDMGQRFFHGKQCICHSDFHVGNIMIDQHEVRVIDTEFGGYAMSFMDLGRMSSSFIVNYVSWLGMPDVPREKRLAMQQYDLEMIHDLFEGYKEMLKRLFAKYCNEKPGLKAIDPEEYFKTIFYDSVRCAALTATFRMTSDGARSFDIERIKGSYDLGIVQKRALEIAEYTLENADSFTCVSDLCEVVHRFAGLDVQ